MNEITIFASTDIQRGSFQVYDTDSDSGVFESDGLIFESDSMGGDLFGMAILQTLSNPVVVLHPDDLQAMQEGN